MSEIWIYADFQNLDDDNRLRLSTIGTRDDLARKKIELREGLTLTFYSHDADDEGRPDELLVDGVVTYNEREQCWVAAVDWGRIRHASDESPATTR